MKPLQAIAASAILGVAAVFAPSASAADVGVSLGVSAPYTLGNEPVYTSQPVYSSETVYTSQPVYSTSSEGVWVEPVYRTEYYYGTPRTVIVTPGYYNRGYRGYSRPSVGIGFGFNFGDRDHHNYNGRYNDRNRGHHDGYRDKPGRYR